MKLFEKITILILIILVFGESILIYDNLEKIDSQKQTILLLKNLSEKQKQKILELETEIKFLKYNLSTTKNLLEKEKLTNNKLKKDIFNLTKVSKIDYNVLAIDDNYKGHIIPLEVIIKNGSGNLFLNVANVFADESLQYSAQTAVKVARYVTRTNLYNKNVLINIKATTDQHHITISGGSAGAAMTLAIIAAIQNKKIKNDVLITGTINDDHTIGKVGGVREKGLAAKQYGANKFLVPIGQKKDVGDIGIQVIEVKNIEQAIKYVIND